LLLLLAALLLPLPDVLIPWPTSQFEKMWTG
jgi:hypothetical protein